MQARMETHLIFIITLSKRFVSSPDHQTTIGASREYRPRFQERFRLLTLRIGRRAAPDMDVLGKLGTVCHSQSDYSLCSILIQFLHFYTLSLCDGNSFCYAEEKNKVFSSLNGP